MHQLMNVWKGAASAVTQQIGTNRWGTITNTRTTDQGYLVKIMLQPEGVMSGWLPVLTPMAGPGWGLVCPPEVGMQGFIGCDTGDGAHGVVLGLTFHDNAMPPVPPSDFNQSQGKAVTPGEISLVSKSGAVLRLCDDGTLHIKGDVRIDGGLTVMNDITSNQGNIAALKGDVSDTHGSVQRLRQNYNTHLHAGVQPGPGTTATTTKIDPE